MGELEGQSTSGGVCGECVWTMVDGVLMVSVPVRNLKRGLDSGMVVFSMLNRQGRRIRSEEMESLEGREGECDGGSGSMMDQG